MEDIAATTVFAVVLGQDVTTLPEDLFIPPDALEVLLDTFSGPLDLLLYLIRQQNIDIMDIPMATITKQYMHYIELLEAHRLELAADYLVMAAMLAEIKSKLLLPLKQTEEDAIEEDPRMALVRRLQVYETFKEAAKILDGLPRFERDVFQVRTTVDEVLCETIAPEVTLAALVEAMTNLSKRQEPLANFQISREKLSVRERMSLLLQRLDYERWMEFHEFFNQREGRLGLVVTFLAVLELAKQALITVSQKEADAPIYLRATKG